MLLLWLVVKCILLLNRLCYGLWPFNPHFGGVFTIYSAEHVAPGGVCIVYMFYE